MEDGEIIQLFLMRSEKAIMSLTQKYSHLIFQVANNILFNEEDAKECENDTYFAVWNTIPPTIPKHLRAFVCRIARNHALKMYRSRHTQKRNATIIPLEELENYLFSSSVENDISARELNLILEKFLASLDQTNRILFVRRYWFGDEIQEIAKLTGMTQANIKMRLSRMRKQLKCYFET